MDPQQGEVRVVGTVPRGRAATSPPCSQHALFQEEKPCLAALLQESPDKVQLTRRILDLKQVGTARLQLTARAHPSCSPKPGRSPRGLGGADFCLRSPQEEQHFQNLHEELNSLAQKLEKQGKSESRSVSARRKHLNKM